MLEANCVTSTERGKSFCVMINLTIWKSDYFKKNDPLIKFIFINSTFNNISIKHQSKTVHHGEFLQTAIGHQIYNHTSSRSIDDKKFIITLCFLGNFIHKDLIACTTTILNSSEISDMNEEICFINRSTLLSLPVWNRDNPKKFNS